MERSCSLTFYNCHMLNALQKKVFHLKEKCPKIKQVIPSSKAIHVFTMNKMSMLGLPFGKKKNYNCGTKTISH